MLIPELTLSILRTKPYTIIIIYRHLAIELNIFLLNTLSASDPQKYLITSRIQSILIQLGIQVNAHMFFTQTVTFLNYLYTMRLKYEW